MKVKTINRSEEACTRERAQDVRKVHHNLDPTLHPFEKATEYTRALAAGALLLDIPTLRLAAPLTITVAPLIASPRFSHDAEPPPPHHPPKRLMQPRCSACLPNPSWLRCPTTMA